MIQVHFPTDDQAVVDPTLQEDRPKDALARETEFAFEPATGRWRSSLDVLSMNSLVPVCNRCFQFVEWLGSPTRRTAFYRYPVRCQCPHELDYIVAPARLCVVGTRDQIWHRSERIDVFLQFEMVHAALENRIMGLTASPGLKARQVAEFGPEAGEPWKASEAGMLFKALYAVSVLEPDVEERRMQVKSRAAAVSLSRALRKRGVSASADHGELVVLMYSLPRR
jgi:hypothetical protein